MEKKYYIKEKLVTIKSFSKYRDDFGNQYFSNFDSDGEIDGDGLFEEITKEAASKLETLPMYKSTEETPLPALAVDNAKKKRQSKSAATLGELLKNFRRQKALQAKEVANLLEITPQYYSKIENGFKQFSPLLVRKIADYLKLTIEEVTELIK